MALSSEQISMVKSWIAEGKKIAEVQTLLAEKFSVSITYMDLRFLIDDLEIELKKEPEIVPEKPIEPEPAQQPKGVSLEMDKISKPGIMASGSAIFSDGVSAKWEIDQYGRIGLQAEGHENYRPSQEDVASFQEQLKNMLGV